MHVIRATFDGAKVIIPGEVRGIPPGEGIIVFEVETYGRKEREAWARIPKSAFNKA